MDTINIESFYNRRKMVDFKFLYKCINGFIVCSELLGFLNFNVFQFKVGFSNIFSIPSQKSNIDLASLLLIGMSIANDVGFI